MIQRIWRNSHEFTLKHLHFLHLGLNLLIVNCYRVVVHPTPELHSYTEGLFKKDRHLFFTDGRLLKKDHGVFKKRRGV